MYHTTRFTKDEIIDLCAMVSTTQLESGINHWPPILGLFKSVVIALTYMRRNHVQAELAEYYGVSQPTISQAITGMTPIVGRMLAGHVPVAEDLDRGAQYIIDGTLLPCWSWRDHPKLYSGKHKTTDLNVQVAYDLYGRLAWVSDPVNGNRHDSTALEISGVLHGLDPANWIGDKGYIGSGMLTPIRKPPYRSLLDWKRNSTRRWAGFATGSSGPSPI